MKKIFALFWILIMFFSTNVHSQIVVDFEGLSQNYGLYGTNYAGITWNAEKVIGNIYSALGVPPYDQLKADYGSDYSVAHSGSNYVANIYGANNLSFTFDNRVNFNGAWFADTHGSDSTTKIRLHDDLGHYSNWLTLGSTPKYLETNFTGSKTIYIERTATNKISWNGNTPTYSNWYSMDDVTYAEKPKQYAVLTGKKAWADDVEKWLKKVGWNGNNIINKGGEAFSDSWINDLKVKAGDEFLFYYAGHGAVGSNPENLGEHNVVNGSETYTLEDTNGNKYKYLWAGDEALVYDVGNFVKDDALTTLFANDKWKDVNKTFIIDSCFSGGFMFGGDGDLDSLKNVRLIASSEENEYTPIVNLINYTYLTYGILEDGIGDKEADYNHDGLITFDEIERYIKSKGPRDYKDAYIFDSKFDYNSLISGTQSPLYYSNIPLNLDVNEFGFYNASSVPEPATMLLLGLGLAGLAVVKRKFNN